MMRFLRSTGDAARSLGMCPFWSLISNAYVFRPFSDRQAPLDRLLSFNEASPTEMTGEY